MRFAPCFQKNVLSTACALLIGMFGFSQGEIQADEPKAQIPEQVLAGWRQLEKISFAEEPLVVQVKQTVTGTLKGKPIPLETTEVEIGYGAAGGYSKSPKADVVEIQVIQKDALFEITQPVGKEEFTLSLVKEGKFPQFFRVVESQFSQAVRSTDHIAGLRLLELLDNEHYTISEFVPNAADEKAMLQIQRRGNFAGAKTPFTEATLTLDPAHDFAISSYEYSNEAVKVTGSLTHQKVLGTWAPLLRQEKATTHDQSVEAIRTWETSELRHVKSLPLSLSDYGLAEKE